MVFVLLLGGFYGCSGNKAMTCIVIAEQEIVAHHRPSSDAAVFGVVLPGESLSVVARSENGWLGFEPGVAQAPNIGVFRLRWIRPESCGVEGAVDSLPLVWAPPPRQTFLMAHEDVELHCDSDTTSDVCGVLPGGSFARAIGRTEDGLMFLLTGVEGSEGLHGWARPGGGSFNGDPDTVGIIR